MTTKPTTPAAEALSAALGFRRVVRPTSEQMLKAMAQAADEQRRVLDEWQQKQQHGGAQSAAHPSHASPNRRILRAGGSLVLCVWHGAVGAGEF